MEKISHWPGFASATAGVVMCTLLGMAMEPRFDIANIAMVYLLAVVIIALRYTRGAAIFSAAVSVAAFDFLFVPPAGSFTVHDAQYLLTFAIMLVVAVVISELTALARRENAARAALALEAQTEHMRSTLLASLSHDMRQPLARMADASTRLAAEGESLTAEQRSGLAKDIAGNAHDMGDQVDKILQMTRLEMGAISLKREPKSLPDMVAAVMARLSARLSRHRLLVEIPPETPAMRVDGALIEQVLANLLDNAARHTPPGTVVRVRARVQAGELVVSVEDFGLGLDERDIEHVFDKFYRRDREGQTPGIGLGLAICRAIVNLHGGRIWAEQMPGGGTAFRFALPNS
jgi:two-component system sensor histidine kinase KdpD